MVRFRTFVRPVPPGSESRSAAPWGVVSPPLDSPMFQFARAPTMTPRRGVAIYALQALSLSSVQQARGAPYPTSSLPGVSNPVVVAGSEPRLDSFLRSPAVAAAYASWLSLGGGPTENPLPVLPVLDLHGFRFQVWAPLAPAAPPGAIGRAFASFVEIASLLETAPAGLPPPPTAGRVDLPTPPGAVPDSRPGVLCPGCGQIEVSRNRSDPKSHQFSVETLRCARPIFAPGGPPAT